MDELIQIALDPNVKAYARTPAISESFKILRENVLEQEQRKQLQEIRQTLQSLEDSSKQEVDVYYCFFLIDQSIQFDLYEMLPASENVKHQHI